MQKCLLLVCAGLLGAVWAEDAYIQSDGTQHIRTGYCANPRTKVVCDFAYVDATTVQQRIFGADDDGTTVGISFSSYINGGGLYAWAFQDGTGNWMSTGVKADTARRTLTIDGPGSKVTLATGSTVNYTATISTARTKTSIWPLAIFASNRSTGYSLIVNPAKAKLYSFAIYEDGAPIHYYKPYRSADGATVGLKDLITGAILTQGAGNAFVGGGDISDNPVLDLPGVRLDGAGELEFRVRVGVWDCAGATLDGADVSGDVWVKSGTTHALAYVAKKGAPLVKWTGDVVAITTGTATDAAVTLTVNGPVDLVPNIYSKTYQFNGAANALLNASGVWYEGSGTVANPDLISGANKLRITKSDVLMATMPPDVVYSVYGIDWYRGWGSFEVKVGNNSRLNVGPGGLTTEPNGDGSRVFSIRNQVGIAAPQAWFTRYALHRITLSGGVEGAYPVEKTGIGTVIVGGATGSGTGNNVYNWPKTTLSAGQFQCASAGIFADGHEFVFNGTVQTPVALDLATFDQTFANAAWTEAAGSAAYNTLTTTGAASKYNVVFTGTPKFNPMGFGGVITGGAGVTWNPDSAEAVFVLTNAVSDTQGQFAAQNGVLRVDAGAALTSLAKLSVSETGRFEVTATAGQVAGTSLEVAAGGKLLVVAGHQLVFDKVSYAGAALGGGTYTKANAAWIEGDGSVVVAGNVWTAGGGADTAVDNVANWGGATVDLAGGTLSAIFASAGSLATIPADREVALRGMIFDGPAAFAIAAEAGGRLSLGVQGIQTVSAETAKRSVVTAPMTLTANQFWVPNGSDVLVVSNKVSGSATLTKDGSGTLQLWGDSDFSGDFNVEKGTVDVYSDNGLGASAGKTTITSGAGFVNLHGCTTHENFLFSNGGSPLKGAANKVSHVYGRIDNKSTGSNFSLSADTGGELHVHGGVYGNGNFSFDRLYVDDLPLHITDRFSSSGSIYLNVSSNWVGNNHTYISSGCKIFCRAPYAYYRGPRSETGYGSIGQTVKNVTYISRLQFNSNGVGIFDLGGFDQETTQMFCKEANAAKSCVTSSVPAQLHIYRDRSDGCTATDDMARNYAKFTGGAGCTIDRFGNYSISFLSTSTTTGRLEVADLTAPAAAASKLTLGAANGTGGWPNASEVRVTGGTLALAHGRCLGEGTDVYLDATHGTLELDNAEVQVCRTLSVYDAEKGKYVRQPGGRTYGGTASAASVKVAGLTGSGVLYPSFVPGAVIIFR